ncbi:MAG TPA: hypothetical protein VJB12_06295 [Candidatus Nanoarchaeia archaeon]|nr:hypothetical protein [Candidatus Nanoarchaeia archaeon]
MSLTSIICGEFERVLVQSEKAYQSLDNYVGEARTDEKKAVKKAIDKATVKIRRARENFDRMMGNSRDEFAIENYAALRNAYDQLDRGLPDDEKTMDIAFTAYLGLFRQQRAHIYQKIRKMLPISIGVAAGSAVASYALFDNWIAASVYASAAGAGVWEMITRKGSVLKTIWANYGIFLGGALLPSVSDPSLLNEHLGLFALVYAAHTPALVVGSWSTEFAFVRKGFRKKAISILKARADLDNFVRSGIAIREANRSLRYVNNVCQSEKRPMEDFKDQLDRLEKILGYYVSGKVSLDDVKNAQVTFVPAMRTEGPRHATYKLPPPIKIGLSKDEHARLDAERRASKSQPSPIKQEMDAKPYDAQDTYKPIGIAFSYELQRMHQKKQRVAGYDIGVLMDLTREKIEGNPHIGELVRDQGRSSMYLVERLRDRHALPENIPIFKMQPRGSLRALYVVDANKNIQVLDIVTHKEYDRMMTPK